MHERTPAAAVCAPPFGCRKAARRSGGRVFAPPRPSTRFSQQRLCWHPIGVCSDENGCALMHSSLRCAFAPSQRRRTARGSEGSVLACPPRCTTPQARTNGGGMVRIRESEGGQSLSTPAKCERCWRSASGDMGMRSQCTVVSNQSVRRSRPPLTMMLAGLPSLKTSKREL